jgi:hypothetical protein
MMLSGNDVAKAGLGHAALMSTLKYKYDRRDKIPLTSKECQLSSNIAP